MINNDSAHLLGTYLTIPVVHALNGISSLMVVITQTYDKIEEERR